MQTINSNSPEEIHGPAQVIAEFELRRQGDTRTSRKLFDYADALREIGRFKDALNIYMTLEAASVPEAHRWKVALFKGQTFQDMGRIGDAELAFRDACKLNGSTVAPVYLAGSLSAQERFSEALQVLENARICPGDQDEVLLNIALNKRALGMLEEAKESLLNALILTPDYNDAIIILKDIDAALLLKAGSKYV